LLFSLKQEGARHENGIETSELGNTDYNAQFHKRIITAHLKDTLTGA